MCSCRRPVIRRLRPLRWRRWAGRGDWGEGGAERPLWPPDQNVLMAPDSSTPSAIPIDPRINAIASWIAAAIPESQVRLFGSSYEFKIEVETAGGWPLYMKGTFNPLVPAVSYAVISKNSGRIYALDLGKAHKNPDGTRVGDTHKHRWTEEHKD
jgi:hypothetical protein